MKSRTAFSLTFLLFMATASARGDEQSDAAEPPAAEADVAEGRGGLFGLFFPAPKQPPGEPAAQSVEVPKRGETGPPADEAAGAAEEEAGSATADGEAESDEQPRPAAAGVESGISSEALDSPAAEAETKEAPTSAEVASKRSPSGTIALPEEEIRGEIESPDLIFLLPRARDRSDEQVIRARLKREITRPLIKEWLEEMLLLE